MIAAAALVVPASFVVPEADAADVRLDGYGFYSYSSKVRYYGKGKKQGGRYSNLGADYYSSTRNGMDFLTNHSKSKSGSLSFEFWGMPYYGATSGVVLMTRGVNPLNGGRSIKNFRNSGYAVFLDEDRYPELSLWEFTRQGWKFRDALSFTTKDRL